MFIYLKGIDHGTDVVYLVNTASNIPYKHFEKIKTFIKNSLSTYKIHPNNVQISIVPYPDSTSVAYEYHNKRQDIAKIIKNLYRKDLVLHLYDISF